MDWLQYNYEASVRQQEEQDRMETILTRVKKKDGKLYLLVPHQPLDELGLREGNDVWVMISKYAKPDSKST